MHNFKSIGKNCWISNVARFHNPENIEIGDNVRIDDFCILSAGEGGIKIGSNIHIACYSSLIGAGTITLEDFSQVGARTSILSSGDDFSGKYLVGPCVEEHLRNVTNAPVTLKERAVLGVGCVVLPGVTIGINARVGAMSLVKRDLPGGHLYCGVPAKAQVLPDSDYLDQMTWYK